MYKIIEYGILFNWAVFFILFEHGLSEEVFEGLKVLFDFSFFIWFDWMFFFSRFKLEKLIFLTEKIIKLLNSEKLFPEIWLDKILKRSIWFEEKLKKIIHNKNKNRNIFTKKENLPNQNDFKKF